MNDFDKQKSLRIFFLLLTLPAALLFAASAPPVSNSTLNWVQITIELSGGLALFLFGLDELTDGLKKLAGGHLQKVLSRLTTNRFSGVATGAVVTGILNSSSITTVLVVGLVTAQMMTLQQSIAVIMGANIGTTVTGQLLAFDIKQYALLPVALGFFMLFISKIDRVRYSGKMILGLGLLFFGMALMSSAMGVLRDYAPFLDLLESIKNPFYGILAGAVFTALIQSSSATVGIAIAMASEGILSLPAGIALTLGANIGTCITAMLASIGKPTEAVRASVVHVLFNVIGVLIWLPFLAYLNEIAIWLSPTSELLSGSEKMAEEVPRQIANVNTFFNIANMLFFISFTALFARIATLLVPQKEQVDETIRPLYLDEDSLKVPEVALHNVALELAHLIKQIDAMFLVVHQAWSERQEPSIKQLRRYYKNVLVLENALLDYMGKIRQLSLTGQQSLKHQNLILAANTFEGVAHSLQSTLSEVTDQAFMLDYQPTDETRALLDGIYDDTRVAISHIKRYLKEEDVTALNELIAMRKEVQRRNAKFYERKSERLHTGDPDYINIVRMETSLARALNQIFNGLVHIAKQWRKPLK